MTQTNFRFLIDKISITGSEGDLSAVAKAMKRIVAMAETDQSIHLRGGRDYQLHATVRLSMGCTLLIQVGPRKSGVAHYRLEWNPSLCGAKGLAQIRFIIDEIFTMGFNQFVQDGRITRLDLALDIPDVRLSDVFVHIGRFRKHSVYTGVQGVLETMYFGTAKANQTIIYGTPKQSPKFLRIERRLKSVCLGRQLVELENPFRAMRLLRETDILPAMQGLLPSHFFNSVRVVGLANSLMPLSTEQALAIKTVVDNPEKTLLPNMDAFWGHWRGLLFETLGVEGESDALIDVNKNNLSCPAVIENHQNVPAVETDRGN